MTQIKTMFSAKAAKAIVAAVIAALSALAIASEGGFTTTELFTVAGALLVTFQAAYWTPNAKTPPDGTIDVADVDGTKTFMLNLDSDPDDLGSKSEVVFKINK